MRDGNEFNFPQSLSNGIGMIIRGPNWLFGQAKLPVIVTSV